MKKIFLTALSALILVLCVNSAALALTMLSITGDDVNMRTGPGTKYKVSWVLGKGYPLMMLKRSGDWYRVRDFEGTIGWVHRSVVNRTPHMIIKVHKNSKKRINIRSGPGTTYRIVAKAYYGVVFKTIEQKAGWAKVRHEDGMEGWIKRSLLWGF
jgi:SH3-like domain-containing protein